MRKSCFIFILILIGQFSFAQVKVIEQHDLNLEKDQYFVQIAAFSKPDAILKIKNDYNIRVFTDERNYKVFIAGGFDSINHAEILQKKLKRKGFKDAFIVLIQAKKPVREVKPVKSVKLITPKKQEVAKPIISKKESGKPGVLPLKTIEIIWKVIIILTLLVGIIILGLVLIRLYKRNKGSKRKKLNSKFQQALSLVLFDEYYQSSDDRDPHFYKDLFNGIDLHDSFNRKILIGNILTLHKNLSGESSLGIKNLYIILNLHKDSLKKLKSIRWYKKAQAIKELTEMNITEASESILKLTYHHHPIVRNEAQLSILKLTNELPATFLSRHVYPLSEWQQLNILHILLHLDISQIPDFSKYLESTNETIVEFSIKMINFFKQLQATEEVRRFTSHKNLRIKIEAIRTLTELEDVKSLPSILHEINNNDKRVKIEVVKAIGKLGDDKELIILKELLNYEQDHDLLIVITKSMMQISEKGKNLLEEIKLKNKDNSLLTSIINHSQDSRI